MALIVAFMVAEVVVGIVSHSLALLSDAGHMLTDAAGLSLGLIAIRLAATAPAGRFTYGLKRAEILSALANGLTLAFLCVWIVIEAGRRLIDPPPVAGRAVLITAIAGIGVNLLATWQPAGARRDSRRLRAATATSSPTCSPSSAPLSPAASSSSPDSPGPTPSLHWWWRA